MTGAQLAAFIPAITALVTAIGGVIALFVHVKNNPKS